MTISSRSVRRPGRGPILASVALHAMVVLAAWGVHRATFQPVEYIAVELNVVAQVEEELDDFQLADPDDLVVETPDDPVPPEPDPEPDPVPEPDPLPDPIPDPDPDPEPPPPDPDPEPPTDPDPPPPDPEETETEASDDVTSADIDARMEGLQRDFPAYYAEIQSAIRRCFREPPGVRGVTAVLRFEIQRSGDIPGRSIQVHQRSGNVRFDVAAVGAIECAGERLGALPDDFPMDALQVQFTFEPRQ